MSPWNKIIIIITQIIIDIIIIDWLSVHIKRTLSCLVTCHYLPPSTTIELIWKSPKNWSVVPAITCDTLACPGGRVRWYLNTTTYPPALVTKKATPQIKSTQHRFISLHWQFIIFACTMQVLAGSDELAVLATRYQKFCGLIASLHSRSVLYQSKKNEYIIIMVIRGCPCRGLCCILCQGLCVEYSVVLFWGGEMCQFCPGLYHLLSIIEEEGCQFQTAVLQDFSQLADKFSPVLCLIHCRCLHCGYLCVGRIYYPTFFSF